MCDKKAEWTIVYGHSPDDVTEACTEHVGELLQDEIPEFRVYRIELDNTAEHVEKARCCFIDIPELETIHENGVLLARDPNGRIIEIRSGGQWVYLEEAKATA